MENPRESLDVAVSRCRTAISPEVLNEISEISQSIDGIIEAACNQENRDSQYNAVRELHRIAKSQQYTLLPKMIKMQILSQLVQLFRRYDFEALQMEAVGAFAEATVHSVWPGNETFALEKMAVPCLMRLAKRCSVDVLVVVIKTFGNLMKKNAELRDRIVLVGGLGMLMKFVQPNVPRKILAALSTALPCVWNILPVPLGCIDELFNTLSMILMHGAADSQIQWNVLVAYNSLIEKSNHYGDHVMAELTVPRLIEMTGDTNVQLQSKALQTLQLLAIHTNDGHRQLMEYNMLGQFARLLANSDDSISTASLKLMAEMVRTSSDRLQAVIDADLLPAIVRTLTNRSDVVCKEGALVMVALARCGTRAQVEAALQQGALAPFCSLLRLSDQMVGDVLPGLTAMFEKVPNLAERIHQCGSRQHIEALRYRRNLLLSVKAESILQRYFGKTDRRFEEV